MCCPSFCPTSSRPPLLKPATKRQHRPSIGSKFDPDLKTPTLAITPQGATISSQVMKTGRYTRRLNCGIDPSLNRSAVLVVDGGGRAEARLWRPDYGIRLPVDDIRVGQRHASSSVMKRHPLFLKLVTFFAQRLERMRAYGCIRGFPGLPLFRWRRSTIYRGPIPSWFWSDRGVDRLPIADPELCLSFPSPFKCFIFIDRKGISGIDLDQRLSFP